MRAISLQQPWALCLVRGIQRIVVRRGRTPKTGRIAVHASTEMPLKETERLWREDRRTARALAELGIVDRSDLKSLVFGGIIGTAELVGVERGVDVHEGRATHIMESPFARALDTAVRSRSTGKQRPVIAPPVTRPVPIPDDQYAWAFKGAVEFEPIFGVRGKQNLWRLSPQLERQVVEAEAWSVRQGWEPAVDAARVKRALAAYRARWDTHTNAATQEIVMRVIEEIVIDGARLDDPAAEAWLSETIARIILLSSDRDGNVKVPPQLRSAFGMRASMPPRQFELTCREAVRAQIAQMEQVERLRMLHEAVRDYHVKVMAESERRPMSQEEIVRRVEEFTRAEMLGQARDVGMKVVWEGGDRGPAKRRRAPEGDSWS